jgi:hypothetical protein
MHLRLQTAASALRTAGKPKNKQKTQNLKRQSSRAQSNTVFHHTVSAKIGFVDQYQETQIIIVGSTGIDNHASRLQTDSECRQHAHDATHKSGNTTTQCLEYRCFEINQGDCENRERNQNILVCIYESHNH